MLTPPQRYTNEWGTDLLNSTRLIPDKPPLLTKIATYTAKAFSKDLITA